MVRRDARYREDAPSPGEVEAMQGWVLLDFGTDGCGHCRAASAAVDGWVARQPQLAHLRIEDGRGRPLGRAHRVKLWPTLVLLHHGREAARVVRPRMERDLAAFDEALAQPAPAPIPHDPVRSHGEEPA